MNEIWQQDQLVLDDLALVQKSIDDMAANQAFAHAPQLRQVLQNPGKMIRPALLLIAARFGSPAAAPPRGALSWLAAHLPGCLSGRRRSAKLPERLYRMAAAMELIHTAALIHDDIIDEASLRRGQTALYKETGSRQAILIGDMLFSLGFEQLVSFGSHQSMAIAAKTAARLGTGAMQEMGFKAVPSRREYLRRIYSKTAVLFMASLQIGAEEARLKKAVQRRLVRIGYNLGMGFQIIDDILDFTGDSQSLGKTPYTDLREGIYTLPVIAACERGAASRLAELGVPCRHAIDDCRRIHDILNASGGMEAAKAEAARYTQRALIEIDKLPPIPPAASLRALVERLLQRKY
ncbi:MAG: polyprenyl synthetase family protein [Spirochaetaceae bacterium]|nr:MAG: polyprenyl synthetase family protein [Spirochaetaceae bacterium]